MSDFTNIAEAYGTFDAISESLGSDFIDVGDVGVIIISTQTGFGEGGFGDGLFGGGESSVVINSATVWTDINTP